MSPKSVSRRLPHLTDTWRRQTTAGNLVILAMAIWFIFPAYLDWLRGEPRISTIMQLIAEPDGDIVLTDNISVKYPNIGSRFNMTYDQSGKVICAKNWYIGWTEPTQQIWDIPAFTGCHDVPKEYFNVCSHFTIETWHGRRGTFGGRRVFCTGYFDPVTKQKVSNAHNL